MKKLILLALFASVAGLAQNTPSSSIPPQLSISPAAPTGSFAIDANGNVVITIPNTIDSGLTVGNTNGSILIGTDTGTASNFAPELVGNAKGANQAGLKIFANTAAGFDTGSIPLFYNRATVNLGSITTRPLWGLYNSTVNVVMVNADGSTVIPQLKSASAMNFVCVDTTGKLISSVTACSGT